MTRYQQLLENYARLIGIEPAADLLETQEVQVAELAVGFTVEGDEEDGSVVLFTSLGLPAPQVPRERLMQFMLEANAFWAGTGGCTLGLQGHTGAVLVCARAPLALCDAPAFAAVVDAFAEVALLWREVVQGRQELDITALAA
ncbi:type III secretion system chaperone [Comamonas endophytica]|uniref:Type III secretion system chaperone n=1 Tax=Comamonas endophytica TaxID=2949090 RepID=A0ABY6G8W9_9BURK|nr:MULTISPECIES: type III secretion system chaperone [unclassified Acidovorax]MCD2514224.1 type III secretion system chaperone [Acidovorax sp. D4N7]UYG51363.1 type III secretion system chaperone [Acidovorax sp. 5MLIR]